MSKHLLKEITSKIGSGATPTGGKDAYKGGDYSLIRSQNVLDMSFLREGLVYINDEQAKKLDGVKVESGDVLFNITGDSICRCCIVPDDILPARVNQHVAIIRPKSVNSAYLMYYLQYLKPYLMSICGNGSSRNALTKDSLEKLEIEISPFSNSIAEILSSLDKKIINNKRITSELESFAKTIYDYWFLQFEFPNEEGKPYKTSGGKMVWCEELKREIPEGWEVIAFNTIGEFFKGKIPSKELTLSPTGDSVSPYVTIDVANNASPLYCNPERMTPLNGETIMVMDGAASGDVYVGNKGTLGSTFSKITSLREDISNPLIYMLLKEHSVIYKKANTGSTVPHANPSFIKQMKFALPKKCERMSHTLNVIFDQITNCRKQNQELESFRNFLLPMLMNGQVTFKDK